MSARRQQQAPIATDGHGQRLSPIDSSFLRIETDRALMHIGWSAVFSVPAGGDRPSLDALRRRAAGRLHWVPRCRQRLAPSPLGPLGEPRWVDDERFDIAHHVVDLTGPGHAVSQESFARLRDGVLSEPLDRSRPLWQIVLVPRLEDGRVGVIGRVHHAMADGTAALVVATLLLDSDTAAEDDAADAAAWVPRPAPGVARWAADPLLDGTRLAGSALSHAVRAVRHPRASARDGLEGLTRVARALHEDVLPPAAADSSLNGANGPRRTLVGCRLPLEDMRRARTDGVTTNDVALALAAGALRRLALEHDEEPTPLKAMIPVSVRRPHEFAELGNRISQVMVWLPLDEASPRARLAHIRAQTLHFKHTHRPEGHRTILSGLGLLQGAARDVVLRAVAAPRSYNVVVSNVRGPSTPLHLFGARLDELYPVVPIGYDHALAIGMVSHAGHLHLGLHADPDVLPQVTRLPELLARELRALAGPSVPWSLEQALAAALREPVPVPSR